MADLGFHLRLLKWIEVDQSGRLTAVGSLRALAVAESDPAPDGRPCLRPGLASWQIDAFELQVPPRADRSTEVAATFSLERDSGADWFQRFVPGEGFELAALVGVQDLARIQIRGLPRSWKLEPASL